MASARGWIVSMARRQIRGDDPIDGSRLEPPGQGVRLAVPDVVKGHIRLSDESVFGVSLCMTMSDDEDLRHQVTAAVAVAPRGSAAAVRLP